MIVAAAVPGPFFSVCTWQRAFPNNYNQMQSGGQEGSVPFLLKGFY